MDKNDAKGLSKTALNRLFKEFIENSYQSQFSDALTQIGFTLIKENKSNVMYKMGIKGDFYLPIDLFEKFIQATTLKKIELNVNQSMMKLNRYTHNTLLVLSKILEKNKDETLWVAIDGYAGAGKTTLANMLAQVLNANVFHTDDFFVKPVLDQAKPLSKYGSNINFFKINQTVVDPIQQKQSVSYQPFDFKSHKHLDSITIPYQQINIIEGAYILHPYIKQSFDLKVFYHKPLWRQYYHICQRSGFKKLYQFMTKWIPNERRYVKDLGIIHQCDLMIHSS